MFAKNKIKIRMRRKDWRPININYGGIISLEGVTLRNIRKKNSLHNFTK